MWRRGWLGVGFLAGIAGISGAAASIAPGGPAPASAPAADDGATVVGERSRGRRILDLAVRSPVLTAVAHVRLLLPPGWSRESDRTWPVLWLLHGTGGDHTTWTAETDVERLTEGLDVIVVMPDGGRCGIYTDWWNHGNGGPPKWETFHLTELRQILERGYRAGKARAIAGNALGGTGALAYAARHRGLFRAAASFSGPLHTLHRDPCGLDVPDLIELGVAIGRSAGVRAVGGGRDARDGCGGRGGRGGTGDVGAAVAGERGGADWRDVWGDPETQRVVWRQHNPYDLVDRLAGVRLYLSSGDGRADPSGGRSDALEALAAATTLEFTSKIKKLGIPASTHFYRGARLWRRELRTALPVLLAEII